MHGRFFSSPLRKRTMFELIAATVIGVHLGSIHHSGYTEYNNTNPGLYVRSPTGWQAGTYWNSHRKMTVYGGKAFIFAKVPEHDWDFGVFVGAATGYPWGKITPMGALSTRFGWARLSFSPPVGDKVSATLHLSFEWELK